MNMSTDTSSIEQTFNPLAIADDVLAITSTDDEVAQVITALAMKAGDGDTARLDYIFAKTILLVATVVEVCPGCLANHIADQVDHTGDPTLEPTNEVVAKTPH